MGTVLALVNKFTRYTKHH